MLQLSNILKVLTSFNLVVLVVFSEFSTVLSDTPVTVEEAPTLVQIWYDESFRCAGSVGNNGKVVTTAQCVVGGDTDSFRVVAHAATLYEHGYRSKVSEINIHPNYNATNFDYDIAVLTLASPYRMSLPKVRPCNAELLKTELVTVYGWSETCNGTHTERSHLSSADLEVVPCNCDPLDITASKLCITSPLELGYTADVGSPVMMDGAFCGVLSMKRGCCSENIEFTITRL